jgi:hypothetical protein
MPRATDHRSGDLFAAPRPAPEIAGGFDFRAAVSHLLADMFQKSGLDRYAIAAGASRLAGKDVTRAMLDQYTSEAREEFNAPAWLMPALEAACASRAYTEWLATVRGGRVLWGNETLHHDLSRLERLREEADQHIRAIKLTMQQRGVR